MGRGLLREDDEDKYRRREGKVPAKMEKPKEIILLMMYFI